MPVLFVSLFQSRELREFLSFSRLAVVVFSGVSVFRAGLGPRQKIGARNLF